MTNNQPNPELWARFVEAVKAGRIEGLSYGREYEANWIESNPSRSYWFADGLPSHPEKIDHLCAELRRWINSKMRDWEMDRCNFWLQMRSDERHDGYSYYNDDEACQYAEIRGVTELDRHISAALWVLEQEDSNGS